MAEPLKYMYNTELVSSLCCAIERVYNGFDSKSFKEVLFEPDWEAKELKQRMKHISETLHRFLPDNYKSAVSILKSVSSEFNGFEFMFFPGYVELYGLDQYEESISALEHFTEFSSSEFAVRPFIVKYGSMMMAQMERWAESDNLHVRRLASEGCRPRLPWAMALPEFKKNPQAVVSVLEKIKDDKSEYVRRSVANNLNDISKDNPQIIIDIAKVWLGKNSNRDRIVKHACRSLLKQADPEVLGLFGFSQPVHISVDDFKVQKTLRVNESLAFSFVLSTAQVELGRLRVEYAIYFKKKNGKLSKKVFKISESSCADAAKVIKRRHSFKVISTRTFYTGGHKLSVIINGVELKSGTFRLTEQE